MSNVKTKYKHEFDCEFQTWAIPFVIHFDEMEIIIGFLCFQLIISKRLEITDDE